MSSKIQKIKQQRESARIKMLTFCLRPSQESYDLITKWAPSDYLPEWRAAAAIKFGYEPVNDAMISMVENAGARKQSLNNSIRLMYMFYASGDPKYLQLFYESIGAESISEKSRMYIYDMFSAVKSNYKKIIEFLLSKNPKHFDNIGVNLDDVNFSKYEVIGGATNNVTAIDTSAANSEPKISTNASVDDNWNGDEYFPQKIYGFM